jgi:phage shock protein C
MFCTRCGVQLEERDYFCSQCGTATGRGPSPIPQRRLVRTIADKKIAGVCSGIGSYLDADPTIVRVVWLVLTFALPPAGIIGYIAAWIIMPREDLLVPYTEGVPQT